jgi:hypothetical protein
MATDLQAIADQIALDWLREQLWLAEHAPAPEPPRRRLRPVLAGSNEDVLVTIKPAEYVEALTGLHVPASGMIRCPFHGDGQERTPSCKVYSDPGRGFYCFSCGRGGAIYDFASALWGLGTRGEEFVELRRRLARELLRAAA